MPGEETLDVVLQQMGPLRARLGCAFWVLDFHRLKCDRCFPAGLQITEPDLDDRLRFDATASEAAAFTYDELRASFARVGLIGTQGGRAWPIPWQQAHWTPAVHYGPQPSSEWQSIPLEGAARLDAILLRSGFRGLPI